MALASKYLQTRINLLLVGSAISLFVILFPPLDIIETANLTVRMIEDMLIFVYAILFGYGVERYVKVKERTQTKFSPWFKIYSGISKINRLSRGFLFALIVPAIVIVYWNNPVVFDNTAIDIYTRYLSDATYLVVAILAGTAITYVPSKLRVILLFFAFMNVGMMGSMMLVWPPGFYTAYSAAQNNAMNTFMMLFGAVGILGTSGWLLKVWDVI